MKDTNPTQSDCGVSLLALISPNDVPLVPHVRLTGCLTLADIYHYQCTILEMINAYDAVQTHITVRSERMRRMRKKQI
jgi:hypothetical protein